MKVNKIKIRSEIGLSALAIFSSLLIFSFSILTQNDDWDSYLGGSDRNHFTKLNQITKENVGQLKVAWTYAMPDSGQMQSNPIISNGILFGISASLQVFALNAATGQQLWKFGDPLKNWASTSRGVSLWKGDKENRILFSAGPNLWALDAHTGKPILSFGESGKVDLHEGLPQIAKNKFIISNTPGTIFKNLIIMPVRLSEGADAAPGDIRAFDVMTGKIKWTFHTIPYPGEYGYATWPKDAYKNEYTGAANNWAGMAVDEKRGILFVPTGSAGYDFWGGNRKGKNLFANCLLALDANTGKRIWHFQTTHHDLWDRDLPAPPNLITVTRKGKKIDAVAQITKQGFVFVFDRVTGKPLFDIVEKKVPKSEFMDERTWPTQPIPILPKPYARQSNEINLEDVNPYSLNKSELKKTLKSLDRHWYAAPSQKGTLILPGFDGGGEWGGAGADPENGILYINSNEMAWVQTMEPVATNLKATGDNVYKTYCKSCHGAELQGNAKSGFPELNTIHQRRQKAFVSEIITQGKGMMPGFGQLTPTEKSNLLSFLFKEAPKEVLSQQDLKIKNLPPYKMTGYTKFLDSEGMAGISPPWGTLNAIDLNTGQYVWKIPLGDEPILAKKGIKNTGAETYGGPIITQNGLLLIASTKDGKFRAFDRSNGKLLFEYLLPAAAFATPSTYMANGKQYIVMACGGTKLGTAKGNQYVAFSLP
jgi:quinoprotein glucose dehydrogenase